MSDDSPVGARSAAGRRHAGMSRCCYARPAFGSDDIMDRPFRFRHVAVQCLLAALFAASSAAAQDAQGMPQRLGTVRLNAGIHNIEAEVAQSPAERSIGLMHRREMPTN